MEKPEGDGLAKSVEPAARSRSTLTHAISLGTASRVDGVMVVPLTKAVRLALPPLFLSSLPKKAIGFSFPRGAEGRLLGAALLASTAFLAILLNSLFGVYPAIAIVWLMGGTAIVILYNSTGEGIAFVKQMCSTCRLAPIIVEHEAMHLGGEHSEDAVWSAAREKYSYEGLHLGDDPDIHSFCPIAARLKDAS